MKNVMISQPMGGKTDDEIVRTRDRAMMELEKQGYSTVNTLFSDQRYGENSKIAGDILTVGLKVINAKADDLHTEDGEENFM